MTAQQVPRRLRKAIEWLEADPARAWTVSEIAAACGVPPRTLQRQFRRYMGQMLMAFVRDMRLNHARFEILRACGAESVTEIAGRCGFTHLGRFAASYRARFGESPSATLRRHQIPAPRVTPGQHHSTSALSGRRSRYCRSTWPHRMPAMQLTSPMIS